MSGQLISEASPNAISSPALGDGHLVYAARVGQIMRQYGQAVVRANLSPSQAKRAGLLTSGTCGQLGTGSLNSHALQSSLESKLRARLTGSPWCEVIWKPWVTPWDACLSRPRAQVLTIGGTVYSLLPTPQAMDAKGYSNALRHKYRKTGHLKHWLHRTALAIHSPTGVSSWPNPMFVEWLMGYPRMWISGHDYGLTATQ